MKLNNESLDKPVTLINIKRHKQLNNQNVHSKLNNLFEIDVASPELLIWDGYPLNQFCINYKNINYF